MGLIYLSVPIGSLVKLEPEQRLLYLDQIVALPMTIQTMLSSARTGAYLRGLLKTFDVPVEKTPQVAFIVLRVTIGEKNLSQLASLISTEMQLSNETANKMSTDIERELFAPIMLDYNQYLRNRPGTSTPSSAAAAGATNVLDLKSQPRAPLPPPIPRQ